MHADIYIEGSFRQLIPWPTLLLLLAEVKIFVQPSIEILSALAKKKKKLWLNQNFSSLSVGYQVISVSFDSV